MAHSEVLPMLKINNHGNLGAAFEVIQHQLNTKHRLEFVLNIRIN